jgi:hypothetical protein
VNLAKSGEFADFGPALCEKLQLKQEDLQKKYDKAVEKEQDMIGSRSTLLLPLYSAQ